MTIPYRISLGSLLNHEERKNVERLIDETFDEIDRIYNKWNPQSEVSAINRAKAFEKLPLSPQLYQLLLQVDTMVHLSGKRFDPTIEPVQKLWRESLEKGELPNKKLLKDRSSSIGWEKFHLCSHKVWKECSDSSLDLGGIAKGFAIDLIANKLKQSGYDNIYVEWGGEISVKGLHPDGRAWRVLITKLGVPGDTDIVIELNDQAIASSGDYIQNWQIGEDLYTHLFNPHTGRPLLIGPHSICSVSVAAPNCMLADAIATTAMLFESKKEAEDWLESLRKEHPEISYWVYTRSK